MQMLDCKTFDWFEFYHEVHQEKVESVRLYIQAKDRGYDSMISLKGRIVTSGKDGKVKVWDLWRYVCYEDFLQLKRNFHFSST